MKSVKSLALENRMAKSGAGDDGAGGISGDEKPPMKINEKRERRRLAKIIMKISSLI